MSFGSTPSWSPVFPSDVSFGISKDATPLAKCSTFHVHVQLAESVIFLQGFNAAQWEGKPPAILRGSLILRVLKPTKLKSINLTFKGSSKTEWPEGIPPKKQEFVEINDIIKHTWPFFQNDGPNVSNNQSTDAEDLQKGSGASLYIPLDEGDLVRPSSMRTMNSQVRSLSPIGQFLRSTSKELSNVKSVSETFSDMLSISSAGNDNNSVKSSTNLANLSPGQFIFQPGDYIYSFEQPIPLSCPETISATFGQVEYYLLVNIERQGAFKSDVNAKLPITIVRTPSDNSVEETEPIAISRDWNTQMHYDIIIASKDIVLDAFLPVAFRVTPMDKVSLHRIRIFLTETLEYYCKGKKVHRLEPTKKFLLAEHRAPPLPDLPEDAVPTKAKYLGNLLEDEHGDLVSKEFEYQVFFPERLNFQQKIHPDTSYSSIKSNHWIKISMRLSRNIDGVKKHFEISIDSPIHVLNKLSSHANTLLPSYDTHSLILGADTSSFGNSEFNMYHDSNLYFPRQVLNSPVMSPEVQPVDEKLGMSPVALSPLSHHRTSLSVVHHRHSNQSELSVLELSKRNKVLQSPELSSNIYQPDIIQSGLASPQAIPLSPVSSPLSNPMTHMRKISLELGSIDQQLPPFQEVADACQRLPTNPPTYLESVVDNNCVSKADKTDSESSSVNVPSIHLSRENLDDVDIAENFQFNGSDCGSVNVPSSIIRSNSIQDRKVSSRRSSTFGRRRSSLLPPDALPSTIKNSSESFNDIEHVLASAGESGEADTSNTHINEENRSDDENDMSRLSPHSSADTIQNLAPSQSHTNSVSNQPLLLRQISTHDTHESNDSVDLTAMLRQEQTTWHPLQNAGAVSPILSQSYSMNVLQTNHALEDFKHNLETYDQTESPDTPNISTSLNEDFVDT